MSRAHPRPAGRSVKPAPTERDIDMQPDPVDGRMLRGVLAGCGVEALVGIVLLVAVGAAGLWAGWWSL